MINMKPDISIIAAMDNNNAIGKNNTLPWHISEDLKYFKSLTENNIVIMGKNTFKSLDYKPLPNRINIVVSSNNNLFNELNINIYKENNDDFNNNLILANSLNIAIELATNIAISNNNNKKIFIIGGGQLYKQSIDIVNNLYITHVDITIDNPDTFFPVINNNMWKPISTQSFDKGKNFNNKFSFVHYIKK